MTTQVAIEAAIEAHNDLCLTVSGTEKRASLREGESLLKACLRQGIKIPHLCLVGDCGSCRCRLVRGRVRLKKDISQHVDGQALARGYLLACQSVALSDVEMVVPGLSPSDEGMTLFTIGGRIRSCEKLNHDICHLVIDLESSLSYTAGQYAQLSVPGHPELADHPRCYSFAEAPRIGGQQQVSFHVRRVPGGAFTEWLFTADRCGQSISLTGPLGDFAHRADQRPMVCVAGGSGLAPIKAILEDLLQRQAGPDVTLFFGARSEADLYCLDALKALETSWPGPGRLLFVPVLSALPADSAWPGLTGYCGEHLANYSSLADSSFYLCGPPLMIDSILNRLHGEVDEQHIHFDRFLDRSTLPTDEEKQ
ncbi:2Fe-2S iron-sulfur cluster binding domain-containing protein [Pseudomonas sp. GD03860]|uniref:2Fe-2S iron-sulfur cluster binding domain-containing protein n=1 Tax=Pseudomonas TaxID=286 RepID=UPI002363FDC6|nr:MULTISPECIES: 2Fe-2S iron-sulfur cluster binding domain-containing protein [Pseudomonas]MDD2058453.1 2Fe-2S iron-sulfur cluster binding domain-containing protein [Pseudomonas putida]MDH0640445.1 2Fe-2S iron-sulfur cluster binding domain-containing protein [Pseudomonas sp. GD03860]